MIPAHQKRRGHPDAFGAVPAAAAPAPRASRYRLLLTRLPAAWELIVFDRIRGTVLRRMDGPVVDGLRVTGALPCELLREGACDADKYLVHHLFLAGAAVTCALERCCGGRDPARKDAAGGDPYATRARGAPAPANPSGGCLVPATRGGRTAPVRSCQPVPAQTPR